METITIVLVVFLIWYAIGVCSFVYYVTGFTDYTTKEIPMTLMSGLAGLISLLAVLTILIEDNIKNTVILKKRK